MARQPVSWPKEIRVEVRLRRARYRLPPVFPADQRRETHEDALGASLALDTEMGAPVLKQIKLNITPPTIELEMTLLIRVGGSSPPVDDHLIGGPEGITDSAEKGETLWEAQFIEVVEEEAPDASGFASMGQIEITVTGVF